MLLLFLPHCLFALKHLFNFSVFHATVPSAWKTAISECRPISLLNILSKALERLIQDQLITHIKNNCLFLCAQSGFRQGHSTVTAVLHVTDDILKGFDESNCVTLGLYQGS
nr:unnamed protein product [Callosobruchus analis]